jgi:hypothetical protein
MPYRDPERQKAYLREYGKTWRPAHPGYWRRYNWRHRGLDPSEAERTYDSFDHNLVCNSKVVGSNKHVDHDHASAEPRGILCKRCNMAIGLMHDDIEIMEKAIDYLSRHAASK